MLRTAMITTMPTITRTTSMPTTIMRTTITTMPMADALTFDSWSGLIQAPVEPESLLMLLDRLAHGAAGNIERLKGIARMGDGWVRFDIAGGRPSIAAFAPKGEEDRPRHRDRAASERNPPCRPVRRTQHHGRRNPAASRGCLNKIPEGETRRWITRSSSSSGSTG